MTSPCPLRKVGYASDREARKALNRLVRKRAITFAERMEDHSYQCPACNDWHLTSKTREESW